MSVVTHYDTLKITRDAPAEVIVAAFKAMAQKYHPDKNLNNPEAVHMMQIINAAYKVLSDPKKKAEHDTWIRQQDPPARRPPPTPKELEAQAKIDAAIAESAKWSSWAERAAAEAKAAKETAAKAAAKAQTASASEKDKWKAWAEKSAADAVTAQQAYAQAAAAANEKQKECDAVAEKLGIRDAKAKATHYDALKITRDAPLEVIQAAYRALSQKYEGDARVTQIVAAAYATLSDPNRKAAHDAQIYKNEPPKEKTARKPTAREIETQANAAKASAEAAKWLALAERALEDEKAAQKKAADAARDAQARVRDADAAKWKAWADKLAAEAALEHKKTAQSTAKAAEMKDKATRAAGEAKEATAAAEKEHAMWAAADGSKDKGK